MDRTSGFRPKSRFGPILTHWGTVVFADTDRSMLGHGPEETSPANLVLGENDGTAYLFQIAPDGTRFTVRIPPDQQASRSQRASREVAWRFQAFRVLPTKAHDPNIFGLANEGLLLCAESDGSVQFSPVPPLGHGKSSA